ncbi:NfeD family protein [Desnuesiella massiliensis]|uniref:NfeD family protein n=1 Tax=Desnuesiella massiliensis TaxID=1650662 RepID=UPI0006E15219|nr:NfeD family protein [Desnuesiella massiliensis]
MEKVFYISFIIGVIYILISFFLGSIFEVLNFGVDLDLGFEFPFASMLRPAVIAAFLTVFGGVGLLGMKKAWTFVFFIALFSGLAVAFVFSKFIFEKLKKAENTSSIAREELIGIEAVVLESIMEEGIGAITYVANGNKYSSPAKSLEGITVLRGEKVIITKVDKSVFYVIPIKEKINI